MLAGAKPPILGQGPGPKGREQGGVLGEGQPTPLPSRPLGSLGSAVNSPAGHGTEPRQLKGFLAF